MLHVDAPSVLGQVVLLDDPVIGIVIVIVLIIVNAKLDDLVDNDHEMQQKPQGHSESRDDDASMHCLTTHCTA